VRADFRRKGIRCPARAQALDFARAGDTLVVWKLDRLARSMKQLIETVEAMDAKGVGFRSITEAIDTTTAGGKLVFHIFGALAEFERSIIRERTNAGLKAARDRGRLGGRPRALSEKDIAAARAMLSDPAGDVRLPGPYALLRQDQKRAVHGQEEDPSQTHGSQIEVVRRTHLSTILPVSPSLRVISATVSPASYMARTLANQLTERVCKLAVG
jgi:hypothetical protein